MLALLLALSATPQTTCSLPSGWRQIDARKPRVILFGETHGTAESPLLVGQVACALAKKGNRLLVGLELRASGDPILQQLWGLSTSDFDRRATNEVPSVAGRQDGVGSEAMVDLLKRLHALSQSGKVVDVVAFRGARDSDQARHWQQLGADQAREAESAENIQQAAERRRYDEVLVLVGNGHARRSTSEDEGPTGQSLAMRLALWARIVSLEEDFRSGTMWNCIRKVVADQSSSASHAEPPPDCAIHRTAGGRSHPTTVGLWRTPPDGWDGGFDGFFWFPVVHASPPASTAPSPSAIDPGSPARRSPAAGGE